MSIVKRFLAMFMALAACLAAAVCMAPRAAAGQRFTIAYTGGIGVYPRSGPSMGSQRVGAALPEGSSVEVACELEGELVDNNTTPATKIWERLSDGTHIPNAYINSGADGWTPGVPRCDVESKTQQKLKIGKYNRFEAARVALRDAFDPHLLLDADCTRYLSGIMWDHGGLPQTDEWTSSSPDKSKWGSRYLLPGYTKAAINANEFTQYMKRSGTAEVQELAWSEKPANAWPGDIIAYDWDNGADGVIDHLAMITGGTKDGPFVSQHSPGQRNRYWSWSIEQNGWIQEKMPGARVYLIRIIV